MNLSEEQIGELKQAFDMFDKDKGGSISTKELGYTMRAMGMNPTENDLLELNNEVIFSPLNATKYQRGDFLSLKCH